MNHNNMTTKKSEKSTGGVSKVGIGFGLTAAAATVAGAYFLYGSKKASQNRKKVQSWALKAKAEVLEKLENAEQLSEDEYKKLVETATGVYGTVKNATAGEVADFKKEMFTHWKDLQKNSVVRKLVGAPALKKAPVKKAVVAKKTTTKKVSAKKAVTKK